LGGRFGICGFQPLLIIIKVHVAMVILALEPNLKTKNDFFFLEAFFLASMKDYGLLPF
jgi:hypothetical protein